MTREATTPAAATQGRRRRGRLRPLLLLRLAVRALQRGRPRRLTLAVLILTLPGLGRQRLTLAVLGQPKLRLGTCRRVLLPLPVLLGVLQRRLMRKAHQRTGRVGTKFFLGRWRPCQYTDSKLVIEAGRGKS